MKDYITSQLAKMKNAEQREILREVFEKIFFELYDESISKFDALEKRVVEELPFSQEGYAIHTTMCSKKDMNSIPSWLTPVIQNPISIYEIHQQNLDNNIVIDQVFIEADYLVCREIISNNEFFEGHLIIENKKIPIRIKLKASEQYLNRVEELYRCSINNGVSWTTPNCPYLHKMFDIIVDGQSTLKGLSELVKDYDTDVTWDIDFGKYQYFVKKDLIPLWNIIDIRAKSSEFPFPVVDKKIYEYSFNTEELGPHEKYLADYNGLPIINTRHEKGNFIISVSDKKDIYWTLRKFNTPVLSDTVKFSYPVMNNVQIDHLAGRLINSYGVKVTTKGELARVINSFAVSQYVKYVDCEVVGRQYIYAEESYECNFFIKDEIRMELSNSV